MTRFSIQNFISHSWTAAQESVKVRCDSALESGAPFLVDAVNRTSKIMEGVSTFKKDVVNRAKPFASNVYSGGAKVIGDVKSGSFKMLQALGTGGTWAGQKLMSEVAKPVGSALYCVSQASFFASKECATAVSQTGISVAKAATPVVKDFGSAIGSLVYATYLDGKEGATVVAQSIGSGVKAATPIVKDVGSALYYVGLATLYASKDVMIEGAQACGKGASAAKRAGSTKMHQAWTRVQTDEKAQSALLVIASLAVYLPLSRTLSALGNCLWGHLTRDDT